MTRRQFLSLIKPHTRRTSKIIKPFSSQAAAEPKVEIPLPTQLRAHYISGGLPMVGFGFMDQTVMIQAGNAIDCSLGVTFGLSTLTAAAIGGLVSNVAGILFGGTLGSLAKSAGLPSSNLTAAQRSLPFVKRRRLFAQALGVLMGCTIGLFNLLFIDTDRSSTLKLQQMTEDNEFKFEVEASNDDDPASTTLIVRGPDRDGLLAGLSVALTLRGCSILDVHAHKLEDGTVVDKFLVVDQQTKKRLRDEELADVLKLLLDATSSTEQPHLLKVKVNELEEQKEALEGRIKHLEVVLLQRRMTVRPSQS
jgi:hypothetical protein